MTPASLHSRLALVAGLVVTTLVGCGSVTDTAGQGMMGGSSSYHYSALTCSAPATLPGHRVSVRLSDMGMMRMMAGSAPLGAHMNLSTDRLSVPAGRVTFEVSNVGWRTHELVILPLANAAGAGERIPNASGEIDETGSLGEASNSCAGGTGDGIEAGTVGWVTLTLAPGRYELLCNLPNHYVDGMHQELVVT